MTYVKAGGLDKGMAHLNGEVSVELYCKDRVQYLEALEGPKQETTM